MHKKRNKIIVAGVFFGVILIGISYLIVRAAPFTINIQPEKGTLTGGRVTSDVNASDGKYFTFQEATAPGTNCTGTGPTFGGSAWHISFCDDFNGTALDYTRWQTCNPSFEAGCVPHHDEAGNQEVSCFNSAQASDDPSANPHPGNKTNENVQVYGGAVHLVATKGGPKCPGNWRNQGYWTGMISTGPLKFGMKQTGYTPYFFTHGVYEARVKFPMAQGLWPSLWMLPDQDKYGCWPTSGEFDVVETNKNQSGKGSFNVHFGNACNNNITNFFDGATLPAADSAGYRIYAFEWTSTSYKWYVNGQLMRTYTRADAMRNHPFYIIANFSLSNKWTGGDYTKNTYPITTDIDWIRVWQH